MQILANKLCFNWKQASANNSLPSSLWQASSAVICSFAIIQHAQHTECIALNAHMISFLQCMQVLFMPVVKKSRKMLARKKSSRHMCKAALGVFMHQHPAKPFISYLGQISRSAMYTPSQSPVALGSTRISRRSPGTMSRKSSTRWWLGLLSAWTGSCRSWTSDLIGPPRGWKFALKSRPSPHTVYVCHANTSFAPCTTVACWSQTHMNLCYARHVICRLYTQNWLTHANLRYIPLAWGEAASRYGLLAVVPMCQCKGETIHEGVGNCRCQRLFDNADDRSPSEY